VKSAYKTNQEVGVVVNSYVKWADLWKLKMSERVKMLIWRIGLNIIHTKKNFAVRLGDIDIRCPLCKVEEESTIHLFCLCLVSRAICFGVPWELHSDALSVSNAEEVAMLVIDPPISISCPSELKSLKVQASIQITLTLDCIWHLRNQAEHSRRPVSILPIVNNFESKIMEQVQAFTSSRDLNVRVAQIWSKPNRGYVKLNVDVVMGNNSAALVVVARGEDGEVVKAWTKLFQLGDPLVAEASAVPLAFQLPKD
jgi:hypothetical protein